MTTPLIELSSQNVYGLDKDLYGKPAAVFLDEARQGSFPYIRLNNQIIAVEPVAAGIHTVVLQAEYDDEIRPLGARRLDGFVCYVQGDWFAPESNKSANLGQVGIVSHQGSSSTLATLSAASSIPTWSHSFMPV